MKPTSHENRGITRAAGLIGLLTLISRILGFGRDMAIAWFFGAGLVSDAFFVAFRLPNLFRRLFGEGSLTAAFIPIFSAHLLTHGKQETFTLARSALRMLSLALAVAVILGMVFSPSLVRLMAPGFHGAQLTLTVTLTRIMFPYVFLICLVALCMGILNALGHFVAPALAPVLLNLSMILSAVYISPMMAEPVTGLAVGVLLGGVFQLALQTPFLSALGCRLTGPAPFYHPALKRIGGLMLPSLIGSAAYQINILVGALLASLLAQGAVSCLYYADRVVQFPLGVFAVSLSIAVLPGFSRLAAAGDTVGLSEAFAHAVKLIFFITLPASVGLIILARPIVALLFLRGAFDTAGAVKTTETLVSYSVGLCAFSVVRILVSLFYALGDVKTPALGACAGMIANAALGVALMGKLGPGGLALAASLASFLNVGILILELYKKAPTIDWKKIVESIFLSMICCIIMAVSLWGYALATARPGLRSTGQLTATTAGGVILGIVVFGISAWALNPRDLKAFLTLMKNR